VSQAWAVCLPMEKGMSAGPLRLMSSVLVLDEGECVWLRGEGDELFEELSKLPGARRYTIAEDELLIPQGMLLPTRKLPRGDWRALREWMSPEVQPAALPGKMGKRVTLRLVRTHREERASVLLAKFDQFLAFATTAPLVRLSPLRFAVAEDGRAVIRGEPLPAMAGKRFAEMGGVAAPCGFGLAPAVDAATIRKLLGSGPEDLILFDEDGSYEFIEAGEFAPASRAAARATAAASADGRGVEHE
jgi:hypothetical protein